MSEIHGTEHADMLPGESGRRRSWPVGVPPMWLSKPRKPGTGRAAPPPGPTASHIGPPPRLLGLWRALAGIVLLGIAWAGLVLVAIFGSMVLPLLHSRRLTPSLLIYALGAIGVAWIAAIALCCIIAGAFCLSLAITRANWE